MPIWTAEREVSRSQAKTLIEAQFPELAPVDVESMGAGWDNTAFLVNGDLVFRFPRRACAVETIERETAVLPTIAPQLSIAVPSPTYVGQPTSEFDWPFAGYRLIAGRPACQADLTEQQRTAIAPRLGEFLRELHALPVTEDRLPTDPCGTLNVARRVHKIEANVVALKEHGLIGAADSFDEIISAAIDLKPKRPGVITHGDLYVRHLIIDDQYRLTGIIDWGDVQRNDPAIDLAVVFQFLPPGDARGQFWSAYGDAGDEQLRLARLSALDGILTILRYGHEISDSDLAREGHRGLKYVMAAGDGT